MSVEQIEQSVLRLGADERQRFLDWILDHEVELRGAENPAMEQVWRAETRRRVAEIESGAVQGIPGEQTTARIRRIVGR